MPKGSVVEKDATPKRSLPSTDYDALFEQVPSDGRGLEIDFETIVGAMNFRQAFYRRKKLSLYSDLKITQRGTSVFLWRDGAEGVKHE